MIWIESYLPVVAVAAVEVSVAVIAVVQQQMPTRHATRMMLNCFIVLYKTILELSKIATFSHSLHAPSVSYATSFDVYKNVEEGERE